MRFAWPPFLLLAVLAVAFFGSLLVAAAMFPAGYDWRHTVMSSLASPRENPYAYKLAAWGMAVSGVCLALMGPCFRTALRDLAPRWNPWVRLFFVLGGTLLMVSAMITPGHHALFGLPKAHAKIAQAAGVGFGLGMACCLPALLRLPARQAWRRITAVFLIVVPMSSYLLCRIFLPLLEGSVSPPVRVTLAHSILGSLAFWEWVGSTAVYLFVALVVSLPPPRPEK